jgi:hypothetical protein
LECSGKVIYHVQWERWFSWDKGHRFRNPAKEAAPRGGPASDRQRF